MRRQWKKEQVPCEEYRGEIQLCGDGVKGQSEAGTEAGKGCKE